MQPAEYSSTRQRSFLPDILVREGDDSGLGDISGRSAVAASAAMMCLVAVPQRLRPIVVAAAGIVGFAPIVHGVHLPAVVVGGWGFGVLLGLAGLAGAGAVRSRLDANATSPQPVGHRDRAR